MKIDLNACAEFCRRAYEDEIAGHTTEADMRFGIHKRGDITYVAFRGSANIKNWRRNLRFWPRRSPRGHLAHHGFVGAFRDLQKIFTLPKGPVVFTGHSFGGALATLFAEKYQKPCVTFGAPRVYLRWGGPELEHTRLVCDDDPVPGVPRILYHHLADPIRLPDDDGWSIDFADHSILVYQQRLRRVLQEAA